MAITITTPLEVDGNSNIAAFAPCILAGTTDRWPFDINDERQTQAATGIQESSDKLRVNFGSTESFWQVDDTIRINGLSDDASVFNGRHMIETVGATYIVTATNWQGVPTDTCTLERMNDSLQIKAVIETGIEVYAQPISGGEFELDLSNALQTKLSSIFDISEEGQISTANASYDFEIDIYEIWKRSDYTTIEEESVLSQQTGVAHRCISLTDFYATERQVLNINYAARGHILAHYIDAQSSQPRLRFMPDAGDSLTVSLTMGGTNGHHAGVYEIPDEATIVHVQRGDAEIAPIAYTTMYSVRVPAQRCTKKLHYVNRDGGYASIEFVDYEDRQTPERVDRYNIRSWLERKLISVIENKDRAKYFGDLVVSPEIYDENGNEVELLTDAIIEYGEDVQLNLKVKYEQNYIR